jgi:hypothetical protein
VENVTTRTRKYFDRCSRPPGCLASLTPSTPSLETMLTHLIKKERTLAIQLGPGTWEKYQKKMLINQ